MNNVHPPRARVIKREEITARDGACPWPTQPVRGAADFDGMSRWRAFVDVLDEILSDPEPITASQVANPYRSTAHVTTNPFYGYTPHLAPNRFWTAPGPHRSTSVANSHHDSRTPSPHAHGFRPAGQRATEEQPAAREPRTRRPLKPVEESALQTLVRLGASLDRSFTARELRSTFRALAQRYHPDRHPTVSDAERMRLGATFAELTHAYGVLHDASTP